MRLRLAAALASALFLRCANRRPPGGGRPRHPARRRLLTCRPIKAFPTFPIGGMSPRRFQAPDSPCAGGQVGVRLRAEPLSAGDYAAHLATGRARASPEAPPACLCSDLCPSLRRFRCPLRRRAYPPGTVCSLSNSTPTTHPAPLLPPRCHLPHPSLQRQFSF